VFSERLPACGTDVFSNILAIRLGGVSNDKSLEAEIVESETSDCTLRYRSRDTHRGN
jgi:hypothetical protein